MRGTQGVVVDRVPLAREVEPQGGVHVPHHVVAQNVICRIVVKIEGGLAVAATVAVVDAVVGNHRALTVGLDSIDSSRLGSLKTEVVNVVVENTQAG